MKVNSEDDEKHGYPIASHRSANACATMLSCDQVGE